MWGLWKTKTLLNFASQWRVRFQDTVNAEISSKAILKNLPFKMKTGNRFEKVAVVTDRKWIKVVSNMEKLFFNAEIQFFSTHQRLEAIQWISH